MDTPRTPFGVDAMMNTTVDYFRKAWSSFNLPSQLAPTVDIAELDKRINNLKAVESWLNLNLTMLRTTIQGLEIQRGTVAAISTIGQAVDQTGSTFADWARQAQTARSNLAGETLAKTSRAAPPAPPPPPPPEPEPEPEASGSAGAASEAAASAARLGSAIFNMFVPRTGATREDGSEEASDDTSAAADSASSGTDEGRSDTAPAQAAEAQAAQPQAEPPPADGTDEAGPGAVGAGPASSALAEGLAAATAQFINPGAWWNMLQGQFSQIVQATAPLTAPSGGDQEAGATPAKGRRKTAGSKAGAPPRTPAKAPAARKKAPAGRASPAAASSAPRKAAAGKTAAKSAPRKRPAAAAAGTRAGRGNGRTKT